MMKTLFLTASGAESWFRGLSLEGLIDSVTRFGIRLLVALAVFWVGVRVIKFVRRALRRIFEKRGTDVSIRSFLVLTVDIVLKVLLAITVIGMMGIQTTSFVAIIGASTLAIGMALQGTLQNFAGGVIVLVFKPYRVGDVIEAQGYTGTVKDIYIFTTVLLTADNKSVIIPNSELATKLLVNYSKEGMRRTDLTVGIAYGESVDRARAVLMDILEQDPDVLREPACTVSVGALSDSSVDLVVLAWVRSGDYVKVRARLNETIYRRFGEEGIEIPFPQLQVHLARE